jgi:hypothetical protein
MSRQTIFAARRSCPPDLVAPAPLSKTSRKLMRPEDVPPPESFFLTAADLGKVRARARAVLEEAGLVLGQVEDAHQVVIDGLDEAGRALGLGVGVGGLADLA